MTLKQLILTIIVASLICWTAWILVLFQVNPLETNFLGFLIFYLSLFFALLGTFFLISFGFRKLINKFSLEYKIVSISFRQSFFFALLVVVFLILQGNNLLTWWSMLLLIGGVTILEFFFLSARRSYWLIKPISGSAAVPTYRDFLFDEWTVCRYN